MRMIAVAISIMAINVGAAVAHIEHPTIENLAFASLNQEHACYHLKLTINRHIDDSNEDESNLEAWSQYIADLSTIYANFCK